MANRATGKGYENENFYENIKFHFLGIENIHVMRSSLLKLLESKYLLYSVLAWSWVNWADLMATQGAFGTDSQSPIHSAPSLG